MTHLHLAELTRKLREEVVQQRTPAWRRVEWLLWRDEYLDRTQPAERLAWLGVSRLRCRLATIEDIWLGGLQVRTGQPIEEGTLLRVELMQEGNPAAEPMTVRVLKAFKKGREWLVNCCFSQMPITEPAAALAG